MKQAYIFVEGPLDAEFLRRILLPEVLKDAEIVAAGGVGDSFAGSIGAC
jgi:hypothetical protein